MLLPFLSALAAANCTRDPDALFAANRHATLTDAAASVGRLSLHYAYAGQGLTGTTSSTFDLASGAFVDGFAVGPTQGTNGFDGRDAWQQDLSGAYLPEAGGDRRAIAVNEAYRNANAWWRADRGGAAIAALGCDHVRVSPEGGVPFEAWFDPASHRLARTVEPQGFMSVETRYDGYAVHDGRFLADVTTVVIDGDAASAQTMRLTGATVGQAEPLSAYAMPMTKPADWSLPGGSVTLPMRLLNNHVYVDVTVNGHGPYPFIIDTGGHDIVTPWALADLGLSAQGAAPSSGAGEAKVDSGYTRVASLGFGGGILRDQTVIALDFSPEDVEGFKVGGMLGSEFLQRFVTRIDYGAHTVTFTDPAQFDAAARSVAGTPLPFVFYDHMPQLAGGLDGKPARMNIDTGSRVEVTMTSPAVTGLGLRTVYPDGVTVTDGWGVGGPSRSYVVRAASLTLGPVVVQRPIAGLSAAAHGAFADPNYEGNVGSGLLKRFAVTFDYPHRVMYLAPVATPDADVGRFDRTGLWINLGKGGMQVMDIAAGGPADAAGIKVGDILTAIDGRPLAGRALSDVRRDLKLVAVGRPIAVDYLRAGGAEHATLIPRELIPE